jgi:hypothetical protein
MSTQELNVRIEVRNPKQQKDIASILGELQRDFPELNARIKAESKGLLPEEAVVIVFVTVASEIVATAVLRFLDKLWNGLKRKDISPSLSSSESSQRAAEKYLLDIGIIDFEIIEREDRGLYVLFVFKSKGASHRLYVSRSDMRIIKYEKVGS